MRHLLQHLQTGEDLAVNNASSEHKFKMMTRLQSLLKPTFRRLHPRIVNFDMMEKFQLTGIAYTSHVCIEAGAEKTGISQKSCLL